MRNLLTAAAMALIAAGAAHAEGTKTVGDWDAVCSNTGTCVAFGFSPDDADTDAYLMLRRAAGPAAAPTVDLVFDPDDAQPPARWTITLDGHPVAGVGSLSAKGGGGGARAQVTGRAALALIDALRSGKSLQVDADGEAIASVSLAGSAAVLLWVDDQQGRVGTVTALERKGPKPAAAVPPATPKPLVVAARPVDQAGLADKAPPSLIKTDGDCDSDASNPHDDIVARLAPGVVLWGPQCLMAAYNEMNIFFIGDENGGHLKRVSFPEPPGAEEPSTDELLNAGFDPKTQMLSVFEKGRGIGDCGDAISWVWNGRAFVLLSESDMPDCRGVSPDDWPWLFESRSR